MTTCAVSSDLNRYQKQVDADYANALTKESLEEKAYAKGILPRYPLAMLVGEMPECCEVMAVKAIIAGDAIELLRIMEPYAKPVRDRGAVEWAKKRMERNGYEEG